ncbi:MAG: hypothetical protein NZO58_11765, partial [Gemmataceae bacterium]|nr:hypothetical protein [Gemmataceae bacterium]
MNSPQAHLHEPSHPFLADDERRQRRTARRRRRIMAWLSILTLTLAGTAVGAWWYLHGRVVPFHAPTHTVTREPLQVTIVERGTLESAENSDVVCRVKAGKKGNSGIIKWVIENGSHVEKGQKLVEIDDSALQEELTEQIIKVNKARAEWISAKEFCAITESQNFSDIESAKTTRVLAEIDLKKFLGDRIAAKVLPLATRAELQRYLQTELDKDLTRQLDGHESNTISDILQSLSEMEGKIELAKSDRETMADRVAWSQRMVKKGLLSRSQAESEKAKLDSMMFNLKKTQLEYELFRKYTIEQKVTELWSKVKEADRLLARTISQADSKRNTAEADLASKKALYDQELDRLSDIENEIAKCTIYSPQEGLVVYYIPEQSRFGSGTQQSTIAQGEPVREGQKLMSIP